LPRVLEYLRERTGRYPDAIGAPGGFDGRGYWRVPLAPPSIQAFDATDIRPLEPWKTHDVELLDYRGTPGCWAYQLVGAYIVEFFPPMEGEP
jgi:hypothetical protein